MLRSHGLRARLGIVFAALVAATQVPAHASNAPSPIEIVPDAQDGDPAIAGVPAPLATFVPPDTSWIADWTFDAANGACTDAGWQHQDLRIQSDGSNFWSVNTTYAGVGGITAYAAVLFDDDACASPTASGTNWDYSIVLQYQGSGATLSFRYVSDSNPGEDFVTVEADSLGLSEARVDYALQPGKGPAGYRTQIYVASGNHAAGTVVSSLVLPDFGPGVHEVYVRFASDKLDSTPYPASIAAALVVDDVVVTGSLAYSESFECGATGCLDPHVQLLNTAPTKPFGDWSLLYPHPTDNEKCGEDYTCAWTWIDPTRPAFNADMAFGPGGDVVRNWLDNAIVSPWVSLGTTPGALSTHLSFRRFGGSRFANGKIVQGWRVRAKVRIENTDTTSPGDSIDCVTPWGHVSMWNSLSTFAWVSSVTDMTPYFDSGAREIQVSFRTSDWQWVAGDAAPATLNPGPGPYLDRVRIGRYALSAPLIETSAFLFMDQAQDGFATTLRTPAPAERFDPSTDRFGSCAFTAAFDTQRNDMPANPMHGDSITVNVYDRRQAGGIATLRWYGAIVSGPHAGKAPAPFAVGANGFFEVVPDSCRVYSVVVANRFFVDLDDTYFRGGDQLVYFWFATDAGGGAASFPAGWTAVPASVAAAEAATGGLLEVGYLPTIDWDPAYLQRIAMDPHGDLDPTSVERANSHQRNCILYVQTLVWDRRSGPTQKTSFMRTLDALGYAGNYDVFDRLAYNADLASRASLPQCTGYALIVQDDGRPENSPTIPDGLGQETSRVDQQGFYRDWLDAGATSEAGRATLWIQGEDTATFQLGATLRSYCGIASVIADQGSGVNPDVLGQGTFTFVPGNCIADYSIDSFSLQGGCPGVRDYDGLSAAGTGVVTHRFGSGGVPGSGAILMNARPAQASNTIVASFAWFDIRSASCTTPPCPSPSAPAERLMSEILACALPEDCREGLDPTATQPIPLPSITALHAAVPNPFNPTTTMTFDLARGGRVTLALYDVRGRHLRTLVDAALDAGWKHRATWNGLDDAGRALASGVYVVRLATSDGVRTRRLVLVR